MSHLRLVSEFPLPQAQTSDDYLTIMVGWQIGFTLMAWTMISMSVGAGTALWLSALTRTVLR